MSTNALHKFGKISDIARTGACCNFQDSLAGWLWQSRYVLRVVKTQNDLVYRYWNYQYLRTKSFFKQLTMRSTFCQSQPASESKKPTRALSVSMQIFFQICATLSGDERSRFRHLWIRVSCFLKPHPKFPATKKSHLHRLRKEIARGAVLFSALLNESLF